MLLGSFQPHARASSGTVEVWSWKTERRSGGHLLMEIRRALAGEVAVDPAVGVEAELDRVLVRVQLLAGEHAPGAEDSRDHAGP